MTKEIAVHISNNGETASLYEPGMVVVFQMKKGTWHVIREKPFVLNQAAGMRDLRKQMGELLDFIGECNTFVAGSVTGVPYFELEKADRSVWEFSGKPADFLDHIWEKEGAAGPRSVETKPQFVIPVPVDTGNSCYRISIKEVQENDFGVTSKQVLLPHVRQGSYDQLEVLCNHIPPWLEAEALTANLACTSETIGHNDVRVIISKKACTG